MAADVSRTPATPPDATLDTFAAASSAPDSSKIHTVALADRAHVLLLATVADPPVYSLPSTRLHPGTSLAATLLSCITSSLGPFPSSFGDVTSLYRMTLTDDECVHHVFVPPTRFPLHRLRYALASMTPPDAANLARAPTVLVPWNAALTPGLGLDRHAHSLVTMLKPRLSQLSDSVRLPVCSLVRRPVKRFDYSDPLSTNMPQPTCSSVALAVTRWRRYHHQVLLQVCNGELCLPTIDMLKDEQSLCAARRLADTYFTDTRQLIRSLAIATRWTALALGRESVCYQVVCSRLPVTASSACHWVWAAASVCDSLPMHPSQRKSLASALRRCNATRPPQTRVTPAHLLTTPMKWSSLLYNDENDPMPFDVPDIAPRRRVPFLTPLFEQEARTAAVAAFSDLQRRADGNVDFDRTLLDRLIDASCDRARSRGTLKVTPRDVREAAQTLIETRRRSDVQDRSPADVLPDHYDTLLEQLHTLRRDTESTKLGGSSRAARVLIVGETSGVIGRMFREAGADVATCDLHASDSDTPDTLHFKGDASYIQDLGWDLVIGHPPCTYLSNAGVQYLHTEPGRYDRMLDAVAQFQRQLDAKAPFVCMEQPKMHGYAKRKLGGLQPTQYVHPWQHGTGQTKPTSLYLSDGLPPLVPTHVVSGRERALASLPQSVTRAERRSRTFIGIAGAMALQWMPIIARYASDHPDHHTAASLVEAATAAQQDNPRPSRRVAAVRTYAIEESPMTTSVEHLGTRPWELPRPSSPIPTLPIVRLRRTYGKWRALEPSETEGRINRYRWQPLLPSEHEAVETATRRPRVSASVTQWVAPEGPSTPGSTEPPKASLSMLLKAVSTQLHQLPRWKESAVHLTSQLEQQLQQRKNALADETSAYDPVSTQTRQPRRPHGQSYPGLRASGETTPSLNPPFRSSAEYLADYRTRFVRSAPPPVAVASASLQPSSEPLTRLDSEPKPPVTSSASFTEDDIIEPPPRLPFVTNAAYIADFAVAKHAATRHGADTMFSIGRAACSIRESISDTGAGPSIIGTQILARLPADAAVSRSDDRATVDEEITGANGQPLVSRGTVTLVFTLSGHPFRHDFLVVDGGDLLLLGNDFLSRYQATIRPFGDDGSGTMQLQVNHKGRHRHLSISLSCAASNLPAVSAPVRLQRRCCAAPLRAPTEGDTGPSDEILTSEHPALVPLDDPVIASPPLDPVAAVPPLDHVTSQTITDEYLLYSKLAIPIPARTEVTVWLAMPLAHRGRTSSVLIDRIPAAHGLEPGVPVACSLSTPNAEGLVAVRLINVLHRPTTIPSSAPIARCLIDYEVKAPGAINPGSDDAYERLSVDQRAIIDSISVDEQQRLTEAQRLRVRSLLSKHIRAFAMNPKDPAHTHLLEVELPLIEGSKPHRHAASRHGEAGQAIVDAHVAEMEANGIIRKSNSQWGSRVVLVKKKSGETRFCIDFRDLNSKLLTLDSPIPRCDEAIDRLASGAGSQDSLFLSTIDLAAGFWTLPIKESDKARTAFVTHRQKYEWNYLPFGVQSGPSYMCRLMDAALQGLAWEVCMPYLDDCAVWSTGVGATADLRELASFEQMMTRLDLVLERLSWAGMTAKASKCVLFATSTSYLGHIISRKGLEMEPAKIQKILDIQPTSVNTLERVRSFVGLCSYYRRFVKGFASITAPLADLTKAGVDVATESQKPAVQNAITTLIHHMTSEPVILRMPRFDRQMIVKTDAAQTEGLGGILTQEDDEGHERVVAYYGRRLTKHERNYTVTEIELLAALESIRTWRPYLWGRRFLLVVDHAALRWLHTMKDTIEGGPASRLMRWNMKLMEYNFEVMHKPGKIHSDADAVSRLVAALTRWTTDPLAAPVLHTPSADPAVDVRASKVAFYDPLTLKAYCWHRRCGGLDFPGGTQDPADRDAAAALLRECDEEVNLPEALWTRLQVTALSSAPPSVCDCIDRRGLTHRVSLWMVPASPDELGSIKATPEGEMEGQRAAVRPLDDVALGSPYREAIQAAIAAITNPRFRVLPAAPSVSSCLAAVRRTLASWSGPTRDGEDHFDTVRAGVTATCWEHPPSAPVPPLVCAPAAKTGRAAVTTAQSLLAADRAVRLAETSRRTIVDSYVTTETPTAAALLEAQANDPDCATLRSYFATGSIGPILDSALHKRAVWAAREARHLRVGDNGLISRLDPVQPSARAGRPKPASTLRPFIPIELRPAYLYAFHEQLGHVGTTTMLKAIRLRVYWPGMAADVRDHVRSCHECSAARAAHRSHSHPVRPTVGAYPFDSVVCDVCDMTESHDKRFTKILVFADSLSRWIEVVPFHGDPTAEEALDAFTSHVACRYGWPRELRSDGGSNLANLLSEAIHARTGVHLLKGAKYHPQSQGIAERVQGTLTRMCVAANEGGSHWPDYLPFVLFSYRATPHRVTELSPSMILYGRELRLPSFLDSPEAVLSVADLPPSIQAYAERQHLLITSAWQSAREATAAEQENAYQEACGKHSLGAASDDESPAFEVGDSVRYLLPEKHANKLSSAWSTPCRILESLGHGNYRLRDLPNNILDDKFHVSQLRFHVPAADAAPLAADEYVVDRLVSHRGNRVTTREYKVKWRQYPVSQCTWEPRRELLRRCEELVTAYDLENPPAPEPRTQTPMPPMPPAPSATVPKSAGPTAPAVPPPPKQTASATPSADLPHRAAYAKGRWRYFRNVSTPRGLSERTFDESAFPPSDLESPHFKSLRESSLASVPPPVASLIAAAAIYLRRLWP